MKIRVLGCHGGELPGCRTTCFLLDERVALDAGALTSTLPLPELLRVDDIFLTHSHIDHVRDVPLLADLVTEQRSTPVLVHGPRGCLTTLQRSLFNDELWPDFTRIPSPEKPVLRLVPHEPGERVAAGGLTLEPVKVRHPVDTTGYIVRDANGGAVAFSGDTGPCDGFWAAVNAEPAIRAVFVELSFPDRLRWLAEISGHLTPGLLAAELLKLRLDVPVLLYHLKPAFLDELRAEVAARANPRLRILELDDRLEF